MNETTKMIFVLTFVCVVSGASLAFSYELTNQIIKENKNKELVQALKEVLPDADDFEEIENNNPEIINLYKAKKGDQAIGYAIVTQSTGFQGFIKILIGISNDKKITNVKILTHQETPGLGALIEDKDFTDQFIGKTSEDGIDAITGATISSEAVINKVMGIIKNDLQ